MGNSNQPAIQLVTACQKEDFTSVKQLIEDGVNINDSIYINKEIPTFKTFPLNYMVYDSIEYTPLRASVEVSSYPLVQLLFEKGADVHIKFTDTMPDDMTGVPETFNKNIFEIALQTILLRGDEEMLETDEKLEILKLLLENGIQPKAHQFFQNRFSDDSYKNRRKLILKVNDQFIKEGSEKKYEQLE
eukprot:gene12787-7059_t